MQSNNKTWHSCFQCHYSHVDNLACTLLDDRDRKLFKQCDGHFGFGKVSVSNYAAQLAWWLNFFSPDRFLIVSSDVLRDKDSSLQVLLRTEQSVQLLHIANVPAATKLKKGVDRKLGHDLLFWLTKAAELKLWSLKRVYWHTNSIVFQHYNNISLRFS